MQAKDLVVTTRGRTMTLLLPDVFRIVVTDRPEGTEYNITNKQALQREVTFAEERAERAREWERLNPDIDF